MKRKLDENGHPAPTDDTAQPTETEATAGTSFADLGLDSRLLQGIAKQGFQQPTLVQRKAIPLALNGKDVLAKAKTGSGKTLAYIVPVLEAILRRKKVDSTAFTTALILVPTRELADQVFKAIGLFTSFCANEIQTVKLTDKVSDAVQRSLLSNSPDVVISTPSRAWHNIKSSSLSLDKLSHLVIDESDLVLSYGYDDDLQNVAKALPKGLQCILMSATMTADVDAIKHIFCKDPALLDLQEPDAQGEGVTQYVVKCAEDEKFLLIYVMFKLSLIKGKAIIFVADIDRCYRLKLFFEQFGVRSVILNPAVPVNTRTRCVEEFNRNVYDIIIASDENEVLGEEDTTPGGKEEGHPKKKKQKTGKQDQHYGISRGIDFKNVAVVVNFDLPTTARSYQHRIGRTARAGQRGTAISFVVPREHYRKHMPTTVETAENDEKVLARIIKQQAKNDKEVQPYDFDTNQISAFAYRVNDGLRAVTKTAIREARTRELRQELANSERLKRHFEENPGELRHLRHDGELRAARTQAHLRHVPDYLLPREGKQALTADDIGFVPFKKTSDHKDRRSKKGRGKVFKVGGRKADPLKTFKARRKAR